jgi:hypothetical protein
MKKLLLLLFPTLALSQSVPNGTITIGEEWTAAQWNAAWASKLDYPCIVCGGGGGSGTVNSGFVGQLAYYPANTAAVSPLGSLGTSGQVLTSNGAGSAPSWTSGTPIPSLPAYVTPLTNDYLIVYSQTDSQAEKATIPQVIASSLSFASATSLTPNCAYLINYTVNTVAVGTFTVNAPTGCTAVEGQSLTIHIKSTNVQTYAWNAAFVGGATALPTTSTGSSKGDWIGFLYDSINSKWDYVPVATGF